MFVILLSLIALSVTTPAQLTSKPTGRTPRTVHPTGSPTAPTIPPPTEAPTTASPTAPVDICTRTFTARFTLTYDSMTFGYTRGVMVYDSWKNVLAFNYSKQSYQEIYQFNTYHGYGTVDGQSVFRVSPTGICAPCARYQNNWAFPVLWNISGVSNPYPTGVGADGCTNYTVPSGNNNWAQYFGLHSNGTLCYFGNQGRLFTIDNVEPCGSYSLFLISPPRGCACNNPQDIALSLDRSTSIRTSDVYNYRAFIEQFIASFSFDPSSPMTSTQLGIVQWGNVVNPTSYPFPIGNFGSIPFTMDPGNVRTAAAQIGCTNSFCNFCNGNSNDTFCISPSIFRTCTACGLYGAAKLFTDSENYRSRASASRVIIVITDGNTNTLNSSWDPTGNSLCCGDGNPITSALVPGVHPDCDNGMWQTYSPLGCYTDVNNTKTQVMQMVPGVKIFAIGVGPYVDTGTLAVIASDPRNMFASPDWPTLLDQLQSILRLTCVEPDPITSCGTGPGACGFCACGTSQLPDGPLRPNFCDQVVVMPQGQCYSGLPIPLNCSAPPCETPVCVPAMNNNTGGCSSVPTVCNQPDPCYSPKCLFGSCVPRAVCNATLPNCAVACPTTLPPRPPDRACAASTLGLGCGPNGACNKITGTCDCLDGYRGSLCQFCPSCNECGVAADCDDTNGCTQDSCVNSTLGVLVCSYSPINCDDANACTTDFCDATGCHHLPARLCDDHNGCTDDFCNSTTGLCYHTDRSCTTLSDSCNIGYCDPSAPLDAQCFRESIVCPRENNCSLAFCYTNATSTSGLAGCDEEVKDCFNYDWQPWPSPPNYSLAIFISILVSGSVLLGGCFIFACYNCNASKGTREAVSANPLFNDDNRDQSPVDLADDVLGDSSISLDSSSSSS